MLTISSSSAAQFHTIFNFSVPEGLPSSEVYEVFQDKKGFLWFATDNGVARFDGKEFQLFHVKDGLTDPVVFGFFEDEQKRIWFRTFSSKLCYLDMDKIKPYPYNNKLIQTGQYPFFNFVYDSKSDALWFSLARVFGKIDKTGQTQTQRAPGRSSYIKSVNGQLLQGTDINYSVRNIVINDREYPIQLTDTTEYKFFNSIECGDKIYVSIYKDLFEFDQHTVKRIVSSDHPIISLSKDKQEHLWVGYLNHGVENYINSKTRTTPAFLKNKSVTKVFQDSSAGFWFTTLESGVYYVPTFEIENYRLPTASRIKAVLAVGDSVLVGDQRGNLFFFDAKSRSLLPGKTYQEEVYALFQDSFGNVWVSAGMDIIRYDPTFRRKKLLPGFVATTFSEDSDHSVWAYGGIRLTQYDKEGNIVKFRTRNTNYRTILTGDSLIYFAGRTGLHIRDKEMNFVAEPKVFSEYKIGQIDFLNDTTLVLATQGNGLVLINIKTWDYRQFDTNHHFLANNIYCMAKTDSILWVGTEKGLVAINAKQLLKNNLAISEFSSKTGLVGDRIDFILPVKETIWAFGDEGFSIIPKSFARSVPEKPIFYIKSIIAGDDTLATRTELPRKGITLANMKNHLTFSFGYISFSNQGFFLRYRLSPESEWVLTMQRTLQFFSLAPGDYLFELQYSRDNTKWNSPFTPLAFTIDSPWWLKWYTIVGALLLMVMFVYTYFNYRQSIYKQKNHYLAIINTHQQRLIQSEIETLERERNRIAKELHDGVGTNLSAIKMMVNQLLRHHREPQATDIEEQFQIALKELKDIIYGLTPPGLGRYGLFRALETYVSKLNKSLTAIITLQTYGREIMNYQFNITVFRIVQELISNSIRHSSAKHITIHINSFDDILNIIYEDDGVGFSYDTFRGGLGLDNIESRIQSVNGTFKFDSGDHGISYTIDIPLNSIRETA